MNHLRWVPVPLLMLADYALTILGAKWGEAYRRHFTSPTYELNPRWRESVARGQWVNPRHLLLVILTTLLFWLSSGWMPPAGFALLLGVAYGIFGALLGRHLGNLLLFRYVNRHREEISGQVSLGLPLVMKISQANYTGMLLPFAFLAALTPSPYTLGFLLGLLGLILAHLRWAKASPPGKSAAATTGQDSGDR